VSTRLVFEEFSHACRLLLQTPLFAIFSTILDTLFLVCYGFFTQPARDTLLVYAQNFVTAVSGVLQEAGARYETPSMMELAMSPAARPYLNGILWWMLVLFIIAFVLYVLFQGTAWRAAAELLRSRTSWQAYLAKFALLNAAWFIIFGIVKVIMDTIDLRSALMQSITQTPGWVVPVQLRFAIFGALAYFALISYGELHHRPWKEAFKEAFRRGIKQFTTFLPFILIAVIIFLALQYVIFPLIIAPASAMNPALGLTLGIAILGPTAFWLRLTITALVSRTYGVRQQP